MPFLHKRVSHLRFIPGDESGLDCLANHIARTRRFFRECSRLPAVSLAQTYRFPGNHDDMVDLIFSLVMDGNTGATEREEEFFHYLSHSFNSFRLEHNSLTEKEMTAVYQGVDHAYRLVFHEGRDFLSPTLDVAPHEIMDMADRFYHLKYGIVLRFSVQKLSRDRIRELLPASHLESALAALELLPLQSLSPFFDISRDQEFLLDDLKQSFYSFDVSICSKGPLDDRATMILQHGLHRADIRLEPVDLPAAGCAVLPSNPVRSERNPLELSSHLVHVASIPAVFQLPFCNRVVPFLPVADMPDSAAPIGTSESGIHLGSADYFTREKRVCISDKDLTTHAVIFGKTGSGKSTLLKSAITSAIQEGNQAVAVLDPHGDLVREVLNWKWLGRYKDRVLYFDFGDNDYFPGINLLEAKNRSGLEYAIGELDAMFLVMYGGEIWGPRISDTFRNTACLLGLDPKGPLTLVDILWAMNLRNPKVYERFMDTAKRIRNPTLRMFLEQVTAYHGKEGSVEELFTYFRAKFSPIIDNYFLSRIVGQSRTTLDFSRIINDKMVCLFNLNKGRISTRSAQLLGMILTTKLFQTVMGNGAAPVEQRPPISVFIDEAPNFISHSIQNILAESRKFNLRLVLAAQHFSQLATMPLGQVTGMTNLLDSVLGNVGTLIAFRLSAMDSERMALEMGGRLRPGQIATLPNYTAFCCLSKSGCALPPFALRTEPIPLAEDPVRLKKIVERTRAEFCTPRKKVEKQIRARFGQDTCVEELLEQIEDADLFGD